MSELLARGKGGSPGKLVEPPSFEGSPAKEPPTSLFASSTFGIPLCARAAWARPERGAAEERVDVFPTQPRAASGKARRLGRIPAASAQDCIRSRL